MKTKQARDGVRFRLLPVLLLLAFLGTYAEAAWTAPDEPAQGVLLEQRPVSFSPHDLASLEARRPGFAATLAAVDLSAITYSSDGLAVRGYLAVPRGGEHLPCIIFNRGGNREFGALSDARAALLLGQLAGWGYVAVAGQYRGNGGGEGREEFGGRDVDDVLRLLDVLAEVPACDTDRIGMFGWSRGGMMTYEALRRTDRVKAAVVGAGVTDAAAMIAQRPEMESVFSDLVPGWPESRDAALAARSVLRWVDELPAATPLLILHGTADWRVDPTQALDLAAALVRLHRPFRLVLFEGGDHGLSEHREESDRLVRTWFDRYLRDGLPWPDPTPHGD